jgi:hypothetical protein
MIYNFPEVETQVHWLMHVYQPLHSFPSCRLYPLYLLRLFCGIYIPDPLDINELSKAFSGGK